MLVFNKAPTMLKPILFYILAVLLALGGQTVDIPPFFEVPI